MITLQDPSLLKNRCLINGEWVEAQSGETLPVVNPANGESVGEVPRLSPEEIPAVIAASATAQRAWAARPAKERSSLLRRWFELLLEPCR